MDLFNMYLDYCKELSKDDPFKKILVDANIQHYNIELLSISMGFERELTYKDERDLCNILYVKTISKYPNSLSYDDFIRRYQKIDQFLNDEIS